MASGHVNRIKGRTHGCNDQCCKTVKKALAKPEPSTHGTFRTHLDVRVESAMRSKADTYRAINMGNNAAYSGLTIAMTFRSRVSK